MDIMLTLDNGEVYHFHAVERVDIYTNHGLSGESLIGDNIKGFTFTESKENTEE